jgi:hypothetical protein
MAFRGAAVQDGARQEKNVMKGRSSFSRRRDSLYYTGVTEVMSSASNLRRTYPDRHLL